MLTDEQIRHMVTRFLGWKLPEDFGPDAGISFKPEFNENTPWPSRHEPVGTNLLTGVQAEAMIRHLLDGMPGANSEAGIGYQGCSAEAKLLIHLAEDDGPPAGTIQPATEWDLWRAGFIAVKRVEDLAELAAESEQPDLVDEGQGVQDFIAEGPPLPARPQEGRPGPEVEVERLTNALHFYGDMGNYRNTTETKPFHVLEESPPGTVARLALAGTYDVMLERYTAKRLGAAGT